MMRSPLEEGTITISRLSHTFVYPTNFILLASSNPCPCGYYHSQERECTCSADQIQKYRNRLSGPLFDRIDLQVEVSSIPYEQLRQTRVTESSQAIRERVNRARDVQLKRYQKEGIYSNSQLTPSLLSRYCSLTPDCETFLQTAYQKMKLSVRAHDRILKVARTIADLEASESIQIHHLAEALQYRQWDSTNRR